MPSKHNQRGKVFLVGAGPGDPGLLTLRGAECLAQADVVLYDYLVNPMILAHTSLRAERVSLGRHGVSPEAGDRLMGQEQINRLMVEYAEAGRNVVRLKGGDPAVFARLAEEVAALESASITYEIVPGITAVLAAGSHAGIPITQGDTASAVAIVTGQERCGKENSNLDFAALAAFPGTLIFYMGVTTAHHWTSGLIAAGKRAETPAIVVRRCSWPDQRTIRGTLGDIAERIETARLRPPAIVVVGDVVSNAPEKNWFVSRPLFGQTVLVTRPAEQCQSLVGELSGLGAHVLVQPAIEIGPPADWTPVDTALAKLGEYDWVVFSRANGVQAVMNRLWDLRLDSRTFGHSHIAAIGTGTADELAKYQLRADLVPPEFRAEALAASLAEGAVGKKYLLIRASRGREVLAESLRAAGATVEQIVVYTSTDVPRARSEIQSAMEAGRVDWITVTSSAIARSLAAMFGEQLRSCRLASISPVTSETLRDLGFPPAVEASEYTMSGVVAAIRTQVETTNE